MAKKTKELTREDFAKSKVDELLKDIPIKKKEEVKVDKLEQISKEKGNDWLKEQVYVLTQQVETLEKENERLKGDYNKLFDQTQRKTVGTEVVSTQSEDELRNGITKIFLDLDGALTGIKFNGVSYPEAKIKPLLNKMMITFPFLQEILKQRIAATKKVVKRR